MLGKLKQRMVPIWQLPAPRICLLGKGAIWGSDTLISGYCECHHKARRPQGSIRGVPPEKEGLHTPRGHWDGVGITPPKAPAHVHWLCPLLQTVGRVSSPAVWDGSNFPACSAVQCAMLADDRIWPWGQPEPPCPMEAAPLLTCAIPPTIFSFTTTVSSWSWKAAAFCAAFTRLSDALFTALPAAWSGEKKGVYYTQPRVQLLPWWGNPCPRWAGVQKRQLGEGDMPAELSAHGSLPPRLLMTISGAAAPD